MTEKFTHLFVDLGPKTENPKFSFGDDPSLALPLIRFSGC